MLVTFGHFWSPFHTTIEGVFHKLLIKVEPPISYKHLVSIGYKTSHFHAISSFGILIYSNTKATALGTEIGLREIEVLFFCLWCRYEERKGATCFSKSRVECAIGRIAGGGDEAVQFVWI